MWWKCDKGHSWKAIIGDRVRGTGCPYCAKKKVVKAVMIGGKSIPEREISGSRILSGYNDLVTLYPELIKEWDYDKNAEIAPETIGRGSELKVWWKCDKGHSWKSIVSNRVKGTGCPICSKGQRISFGEKAVLYYMRLVFNDVEENYKAKWLGKSELDIYIPELNVALEYDGAMWHADYERDLKKDELCHKNNITLIRIREQGAVNYESTSIKYYMKDDTDIEIENAIKYVFEFFTERFCKMSPIEVNLQETKENIYSMVYQSKIENSLKERYPYLLAEWDYEKNGDLKPDMVFAKSKIRVWWKCKLGHSWQTVVHTRTNGSGCPVCSGKKVLIGYNDLATIRPDIALQWNIEKNNLSPTDVTVNSNKKVWWICENGHEWESKINNRVANNQGCPVCRGNKVLKGYNDLKTLYPEIAREWDYEKNGELKPDMFRPHSNKAVWWICPICKESYNKVITYRTTNNTGCPKCYRVKRKRNKMS